MTFKLQVPEATSRISTQLGAARQKKADNHCICLFNSRHKFVALTRIQDCHRLLKNFRKKKKFANKMILTPGCQKKIASRQTYSEKELRKNQCVLQFRDIIFHKIKKKGLIHHKIIIGTFSFHKIWEKLTGFRPKQSKS